jgi:hypothetical protein
MKYTVEVSHGCTSWYKEDTNILHRENGPAVEWDSGSKSWYLNGQLHRVDGPAIEYADGEKWWYVNGEKHRENGPAIEFVDGVKRWYLNGKQYSEQEFNEIIAKKNNSCDGKIVEIDGKKYKLTEVDA